MNQKNDKKPVSKSIADWAIFKFLKESNGKFSITRLILVFITMSVLIDWQHAFWFGKGVWHPDKLIIGLISGIIGVGILQKIIETKTGIKQISKIQQSIDLGKKEIKR